MGQQTIGVVIPAIDKESAIRERLPAALAVADQVVVSDGGSRDGTVELARQLGANVVCGAAGRGAQLNHGAGALGTDILLFVHADTSLPPGAVDEVRRAVGEGAVGGGFLMRFDSPRPIFRLGSWLVNLRTRLSRAPLGDQVHFATRAAFDAIGGYRDWPILEDLDFIRRLGRHGRLAIIPRRVVTSARRYERRGIVRTIATNWLIWLLFLFGASPHRLARLYRHTR